MRFWYILILGAISSVILYFTLGIQDRVQQGREIELDAPIQVVLKSNEQIPMAFWDVAQRGIRDAAVEFGVEVEFSGPRHESEVIQQQRILENIIAQRPPAILLAAGDFDLLSESMVRSEDADIPVITFDSGVNSDVPLSFIATDNHAAGVLAGAEMRRLMRSNDRKEIAIMSHSRGTATAIDREEGVRESLADENVIGTWYCDVNEQLAYEITMELLDNPRLGGIVALNEAASLGVARAVEERGTKDSVLVVGFDSAARELTYIERGILKATVVQRPYNMGYLAVKTAVEHLLGRRVESFIDTGAVLINAENMFRREFQELLFPFPQP